MKILQEKAYTIHDLIGKTGVEKGFDAELRGYAGKKRGKWIRRKLPSRLPGSRKATSGQRLLLSLSCGTPRIPEQLLIQNEKKREHRHPSGRSRLKHSLDQGGRVVLDPNTGEVIALAPYPRLDPNDFVSSGGKEANTNKQSAVTKWLENEAYIGEIWDREKLLERERYDQKTAQSIQNLVR